MSWTGVRAGIRTRFWGNGPLLCLLLLATTPVLAQEWDARLHWVQRVVLGTPVSGVIDSVSITPGKPVRQGQILLRLDTRPLEARIEGLEAELIGKRHDRDEARRELDRTQELYDRTLLADHDLDLTKIALATAEAALKTTEAQLTQAKWELEYSRIRAPFDAWVLHRNAEPGQTVISNLRAGPLIVVARAGTMRARVMADAGQVSAFAEGQRARVRVMGRDYAGQVQQVGLEPDAEGRYPVDIQFATGKALLRAGLPAKVVLQ